jgi:hypothetical protein
MQRAVTHHSLAVRDHVVVGEDERVGSAEPARDASEPAPKKPLLDRRLEKLTRRHV